MKTALLLVDDDRLVSRVLARSLRQFSIDVVVADSFDDAVGALRSRTFSALASDFMMGRKNGPDLLSWSAEHQPAVRRVLFTGIVNAQLLSGVVASGQAHHVLHKPFTAAELYAVVVGSAPPLHPAAH